MKICPEILRQRLVIEGIYGVQEIEEQTVRDLLAGLTGQMGMTPIAPPLIFSPDAISELHHGIGGFQPWAESGCSLYTWRDSRLFTLDVYSCKGFDPSLCVSHIREALSADTLEWRES